jgi:hypothetical protein
MPQPEQAQTYRTTGCSWPLTKNAVNVHWNTKAGASTCQACDFALDVLDIATTFPRNTVTFLPKLRKAFEKQTPSIPSLRHTVVPSELGLAQRLLAHADCQHSAEQLLVEICCARVSFSKSVHRRICLSSYGKLLRSCVVKPGLQAAVPECMHCRALTIHSPLQCATARSRTDTNKR